ncbi:tripartite tricarboxylate transporter permease [Nanoarchaeota archaeon]
MFLEITAAILVGIIFGVFTGLIPGVHINLVAVSLIAASTFLLQYTDTFPLVVFIVSMSITHTFIDFIPSIFLGAPEESTALGVLPGHKMLMKGLGYEAVKLSIIGSYFGLLLMLLITPLVLFILPKAYPLIEKSIPYILIVASLFLILKENNRFWAFFIFLLSGVLGIATLNFMVIKQPLFPLLTGLFGISILLDSINQKTKIPEQKISKVDVSKKEITKALGASIVSAPICSFLPGLGAAQAAVLGSQISGKLTQKGFLILLGAINTIVMGLTFVAIYTIGKSRSGTAAAVNTLLNEMTLLQLTTLLFVMLVAGSFSVFIGIAISKFFAKNIQKVDYGKICWTVIIFLIIMSLFLSGFYSLIVLITASAIGILTIKKQVRKMNLMGCLIIPVILWLLI